MESESKKAPRATRATKAVGRTAPATAPAPKIRTDTTKQSAPVKSPAKLAHGYEYDVCLSFAGEDRAFVNRVVGCLKRRGVHYFYDEEVKADLWGKDLYAYLDDVYQHRARYGMVFVSKYYKKKRWTNHERQSIQARVFQEMGDYLLPVVLDATDIPGLRLTTGYLDGRKDTPSVIADTLRAKLDGKPALPTRTASKPAASFPSAFKTSAPVRKVSTSGKWVLLGEHFFTSTLVEENSADTVTLQISAKTSREEAELRSLAGKPQWARKGLSYAHGNDAALCRIEEDVQVRSQNGKPTFTFALKLERPSAGGLMEMSFNGVTADQIAERRARLILLGEKPKASDRFVNSHIESSPSRDHALQANLPARVWKSLGEKSTATLQKVRLACLCELKTHAIAEHVLELTLGPVTPAGMGVRFEGRRHTRYTSEAPASVSVSGICPL